MGGEGGEKSVRKLEVKLKISEALYSLLLLVAHFLWLLELDFILFSKKKERNYKKRGEKIDTRKSLTDNNGKYRQRNE